MSTWKEKQIQEIEKQRDSFSRNKSRRTAVILAVLVFGFLFIWIVAPSSSDGFKILLFEPQEYNNKAQIIIRAVLEKETSDEDKKRYLLNMYENARKYDKFQSHSEPTVIGIYLYESEAKMSSSNSAFCAMLWKSPINSEPEITMGIGGSKEGLSKEDLDYYDSIKNQMLAKGIDVCDFYFQWQQINKKAWADSKTYGELWEIKQHKELADKYHVSEELAGAAITYGYKFCK